MIQLRENWDDRPLYWDNVVQCVLNEKCAWAKDHIYIGDHYFLRGPLVLPLTGFGSHGNFFGGTRDGKSTLLAQIAAQVLAMGVFSILVLDFKGSTGLQNDLFWQASQVVHGKTGRRVYKLKRFNPRANEYSHNFNPLRQTFWHNSTPHQRAESLLGPLGIVAVEGSENAFFAAMTEIVSTKVIEWCWLVETIEALLKAMDDRDLYKGLKGNVNDWQHSRHFVGSLGRLADCAALQRVSADPEQNIDLEQILCGDQPHFVYCDLSVLEDKLVSQSTGRLIATSLVRTASQTRYNPNRRPVLVIVDEAQHIIGPSFVELLEIARESGVSFLMFNQSRAQLATAAADYRDLMVYCIGLECMLSARTPEDIRYIMETSHETISPSLSWSQERYVGDSLESGVFHPDFSTSDLTGKHSLRVSETIRSRPDKNRILAVSADQQGGFIRSFRNEGLWAFSAGWVPFRWHRHLHADEHAHFAKTKPSPLPGMVLNVPPSLERRKAAGQQGDAAKPIQQVKGNAKPGSLTEALKNLGRDFNGGQRPPKA